MCRNSAVTIWQIKMKCNGRKMEPEGLEEWWCIMSRGKAAEICFVDTPCASSTLWMSREGDYVLFVIGKQRSVTAFSKQTSFIDCSSCQKQCCEALDVD